MFFFIVKLGFNPINPIYIIKSTTVEPRHYFTHGHIKINGVRLS